MKYWPFTDPFYPQLTSTGGPIDQTASFQPDIGIPITRRRTTAKVESWSLAVMLNDFAQLAEFEAWFQDDLEGGALPFVWRHPVSKAVARFRFTPATYDTSYPGGEWVRVGFSALILPGRLWFAPYVPEESARVPDFVADYLLDRYWIGQTEVSASDLAGISGDYLVLTQRLTYTRTWSTVTYSGDVPQTPPPNTDWIAGFLNA